MEKKNTTKDRIVIYQLLPRVFTNTTQKITKFGTIEENGCGKLNHLNSHVLEHIKMLGISHIWFTGILEHATCTDYSSYGITRDHPAVIKGVAGSPYAIKDYYDIDPDLAENVPERMTEFENLVRRCHELNLGVIIDFVPNHLARQYHSDAKPDGVKDFGRNDNTQQAFSASNNFYYQPGEALHVPHEATQLPYVLKAGLESYHEFPAKATGNDRFDAYPKFDDWYETVKLNYGVDYVKNREKHFEPIPDTWKKMLDILNFWAKKNVDGFRCDMAEMVPVEFWNWAIPRVKEKFPGIVFIAEIYNPRAYRSYIEEGHFDFLYDKMGLYDTLRSVMEGKSAARDITKVWQDLEGLDAYMLRFMENHDEQRIASRYFAGNAQAGIPAMTVAALINTGPVMIYSGQESGEPAEGETGFSGDDGRTSIFDYCSMPEHVKWINNGKYDGGGYSPQQKKLYAFYQKLLNLAGDEVFSKGHFYDLMWCNPDNEAFDGRYIYTFLRFYEGKTFWVLANFHPTEQRRVSVKFPEDLFEWMGLNGNFSVAGKEILVSHNDIFTDRALMTNDGLSIILENLSVRVFELQFELKSS